MLNKWIEIAVLNTSPFEDNGLAETDILEQARLALHRETRLNLLVDRHYGPRAQLPYDAEVHIEGYAVQFGAEIKRWAQHLNFGALVHQLREAHPRPILIADYINPKLAERLKAERIQFLDTAGNAYINSSPLYIYVVGKRLTHAPEKQVSPSAAFDTAGLKVVFALLCDPKLAQATYRDIAQKSQVALGTVGRVINGLKDAGYLIEERSPKKLMLTNREKLLARWTEAYPERLKPKLQVGHFLAPTPNWWQDIDLRKYGAYWGGEIAAAKYIGYLKPGTGIIYLPQSSGSKLISDARLRKAFTTDGEGVVRIYRPFWVPEQVPTDLVPPILGYADLIATGDSRNLETAQILHDKFISEHLRENQ